MEKKHFLNLPLLQHFFIIFLISLLFSLCDKKSPSDNNDNKNEEPEYGTVEDIDGNTYKTVKIGDQWWMAENLRVTHYQNGDSIPNVSISWEWDKLSTGAYCAYNNSEDCAANYGYLYNWYAVTDIRNLAPEGWHVPSDDEWRELEVILGGISQETIGNGCIRVADVGGKLKESGTYYWKNENRYATNESGFTALPGGYIHGILGDFDFLGYYAYFWSSTAYDTDCAYNRYLYFENTDIYRYYTDKRSGYSVRCVRDD